ncbi:hypothetical protein JNL27_18095, partial [bacterium]|nr:hypothetical protein [bacterium]
SKKIFSINAQPIVEPDPTVAVFYMTTHNPTGEIFEGLKIVQTDLYDTHDGYYGSILFDHNMSTQLAPFQTVTDTLYKGVSFKPLITLPFSIDFLKAIMVLKDQNNRIRFMTVDSVRIDRPA